MQQIYKLPNAAGSKITVSTTAGTLLSFVQTAASDTTYKFPSDADAVDLHAESNDFRFLVDGNTPTATEGIPVAASSIFQLRGVSLGKLQLIRSGGSDAVISIQIGKSRLNG